MDPKLQKDTHWLQTWKDLKCICNVPIPTDSHIPMENCRGEDFRLLIKASWEKPTAPHVEIPVIAPAWFGGKKSSSGVSLKTKIQIHVFHREEAAKFFSPLALKVTDNSQAIKRFWTLNSHCSGCKGEKESPLKSYQMSHWDLHHVTK